MDVAEEIGNEVDKVDVEGTSVGIGKEVKVVTPPAGYGHQLKLDVVVDRTAPTVETSWRGEILTCAIMEGTTVTRKHKDSRDMALFKDTQADRYSGTTAKSSGFSDCDSTLYCECRKVAHRSVERESCS